MQAPGITRHRRPFLAPLWAGFATLLLLAGIGWIVYRNATTTVVLLVRPAQSDPGTIEDPPVSPEGEAHAARLARLFADGMGPGRLDAIYESDDRRAQQTVAPLAEELHRAPRVFKSGEARAVAARVLHEHPGGTVLVVASGVVLPEMIAQMSGVHVGPATDDAGSLYVVSVPSIGRAHVVRLRF